MMKEFLWVGAGGWLGSMARYAITLCLRSIDMTFPWGTFVVNVVGCFLMGLLYGMGSRQTGITGTAMVFLSVGVCGGFTTFSTFSRESFAMLQAGEYFSLIVYVAGSVVVGLLAMAGGTWLAR